MKRYWPLIVIVLISFVGGAALLRVSPSYSLHYWMVNTSGVFFLFLSTVKLFDLKGFYEGFSQYDLVASKFPLYGYLYPFIELFIALCFLSHFLVKVVALVTLVIMLVTLVGVIVALFGKKELRCACLGTKLDLPLGVVSVVESILMGLMAIMIARGHI